MENLTPTLLFLVLAVFFLLSIRGNFFLQIYIAIVVGYLNVFPAVNYLFSDGVGMEAFGQIQILVILFFEVPLIAFLNLRAAKLGVENPPQGQQVAMLSTILPIILGGFLVIFLYVAIEYGLFFRRIGHEALQQYSADVPILFLYIYRGVVETSFFVIIVLLTIMRSFNGNCRNYPAYKLIFWLYLAIFFVFFASNSRMQFVLLLLCIISTQPNIANLFFKRQKVLKLSVVIFVLVLGMTMLREIYFEQNERLSLDSISSVLFSTGSLIAARLDSVSVLNKFFEDGFNPFGFHLSGIAHVLNFYVAFFFDYQTYLAIKESLATSPSVVIAHTLLSSMEIDFPKSMILDMFLTFGVLGLLLTAFLLGSAVRFVQIRLHRHNPMDFGYLVSAYTLPMLLEFEKEFIGFLFAFLKWLPFFAIIFIMRPRLVRRNIGVMLPSKISR